MMYYMATDKEDKPEGYVFGRPTKYKPEYCQKLIDFMEQGYSYEAFAGSISVVVDTLREWEKVHEDFSAAKGIAFHKSRLYFDRMGLDHMVLPKGITFNNTVWNANMKNRFGFRDRIEKEITHSFDETMRTIADKLPD